MLCRNIKLALETRDDGAVTPTVHGLLELATNPKHSLLASESDDTIVGTTNRGRKLKRKARFVSEGKLNDGLGANGYKEVKYSTL